jgi:hypothetical protein
MKFLVIIFASVFSIVAVAQEQYFYAAYNINKPYTNTEWLDATSNNGFRIGYRSFINDNFSAGIDVSSATYEQYNPTETKQTGSGALTTDYFKYIYSYSVAASGQYNFRLEKTEAVVPYIGLGLGANNNEYAIYYNVYEESERKWGFLARPEVGLLVKIGRRGSFGVIGAIHYDYSTNKSEKFGYDGFTSIGVQVGVALMDLY